MADIELVIKISSYDKEWITNGYYIPEEINVKISEAIANGTPLSKGHGNLVDYEELKNNASEYGAYAEATLSHMKPMIIIEADEAESEEV